MTVRLGNHSNIARPQMFNIDYHRDKNEVMEEYSLLHLSELGLIAVLYAMDYLMATNGIGEYTGVTTRQGLFMV